MGLGRPVAKKKLEIPFILEEAVKNGRVILFLGAGASKECRNLAGASPPDSSQLRGIIAQKYFGKSMENRSVMAVAEMAIETGAGRPLVFDTVNASFEGFEASEAHRKMIEFNWRAIATTNYDLFVESAYGDSTHRRQVLLPFVKDQQPIDDRKSSVENPLEYIKLHGCLNHRLDSEIPLVLSWEQYEEYALNRKRLFDRLSYLAQECPVVFIGYGIADLHIRSLVYKINKNLRPRWYIVDPGAEEEDIRLWNSKNFDVLVGSFSDFMKALDSSIPKLMRFLTPSTETVNFPLRKFYASDGSQESDALRAWLSKDAALVHASMALAEQTAHQFYSGYDTGWGGVFKNFDAKRKCTEDVLFKTILEFPVTNAPTFLLLRGPAGAGKTITLKRAAYEAALTYAEVVIWLEDFGSLRPELFAEIYDLVQRPFWLVVDQVALHANKLAMLLKFAKLNNIPLRLVGAEREADWTTYCGALEQAFMPHFLRVGILSSVEVQDLLDRLELHDCLGDLKGRSRPQQLAAFMDKERADRQLLVALHELTRGYPFEQIVFDEYERVPEKARRLYLDIASMHQFSVPVRAGTISRVSGVNFRDFEREFLAPLKDMVFVSEDGYGDYHYRTRHASIARMIFSRVCETDSEKAAQFIRLIAGLDVGYSTDRRTLEGICKGRRLAKQFKNADDARDIFGAASDIAPSEAYLTQQWAIFESAHPNGDILDAERLAIQATEKDPHNSSFIHTQAEVARRRANLESSLPLKEQLRRQSRMFLDQMSSQDRFNVSSRCKILVDEVSDITEWISDQERTVDDRFLADKLHDAEVTISRAQQQFPEDAEILEIESRLWDTVKDKERALRALERAWKKMPRGSGVAIKLSKIHGKAGRSDQEKAILDEALSREPEDKAVHFAFALFFLNNPGPDWDQQAIIRHLNASFQTNDSNFEERYLLAQFYFAIGDVDRARSMLFEIDRRSPSAFRKFAPKTDNAVTRKLPSYTGTIEAVHAGFFFIRSGIYPDKIFAHRASFEETEVDEVEVGHEVYFRLRFNRRGPVAISTHLKPSGWARTEYDRKEEDIDLEEGLTSTTPVN